MDWYDIPKLCDVTGELVDEEGVLRFFRCSREPGHSGAWHTGWEFGPNMDMSLDAIRNRKQHVWPVEQHDHEGH